MKRGKKLFPRTSSNFYSWLEQFVQALYTDYDATVYGHYRNSRPQARLSHSSHEVFCIGLYVYIIHELVGGSYPDQNFLSSMSISHVITYSIQHDLGNEKLPGVIFEIGAICPNTLIRYLCKLQTHCFAFVRS